MTSHKEYQLQARNKDLEAALSTIQLIIDDPQDEDPDGDEVFIKIENTIEEALAGTETPANTFNYDEDKTNPVDLIKFLEDECLNLECENEPTGGDDYSVAWKVYSHHQSSPQKRLEGFGRTPVEAIKDAISS